MKNNKNNKIKIPKDAIEYQSDAIELDSKPLPLLAKSAIPLMALFLACMIVWASLCKIDIYVVGQSKVISKNPRISLKPLERAVIKEIKIKVGDIVKKNQSLFIFDPTFNKADEERIKEKISSTSALVARLKAERDQRDFTKTKTNDENLRQQIEIFKRNQSFYKDKLANYDESLKKITAKTKTTKIAYESQKEQLKVLKKIEQIELDCKEASSRRQRLETQLKRMDMEKVVTQYQNTLSELDHERLAGEAARRTFVEDWYKKILENLVKYENEIIDYQKQLDKAARLSAYVELKSPCNAMVHEIAAFSVGSAVREAEPLVTLIPLDGELEISADVKTQDIGKIMPNDPVKIKLNAFPFQKHGALEGNISRISKDIFQVAGAMGSQTPVYRCWIKINPDKKLLNIHESFKLIPGMEAQSEIKVGKRRIIEYLIYPLIKSFDQSFREPN